MKFRLSLVSAFALAPKVACGCTASSRLGGKRETVRVFAALIAVELFSPSPIYARNPPLPRYSPSRTPRPAPMASITSLALTTLFTPSPSCFKDIYWVFTTDSKQYLRLPSSACLPPGWSVSAEFSPGICPYGYTIPTDCTKTGAVGSLPETSATCCPV